MVTMPPCAENTAALPVCQWISPEEAVGLDGQRIIIFGAGKGCEEFITHQRRLAHGTTIRAITDNDASLWGKTIFGNKIIPPKQLRHEDFDRIVVTSISGRDAIAGQLIEFGFRQNEDFILIGCYPAAHLANFRLLRKEIGTASVLRGANCLHVGPGGFLGLETLLYCFGADRVDSIDKFSFAINFPDITSRIKQYQDIRKSFNAFSHDTCTLEECHQRYSELFAENSNSTKICTDKIAYHYPVDICELPFANEQFDLTLSFAVLEHVLNPISAVQQLARVLRPGGIALHHIVTTDHRSFSAVHGFTPFSFRCYSADEWLAITSQKFPQNRLLPCEWKDLFNQNGLAVEKYKITTNHPISFDEYGQFHKNFHRFTMEELGQCDCLLVARKQK